MRRPLAHGKALLARRAAGERVGLLVVAVRDWSAGTWFESRPEVARVVLPDDVPVGAADWSPCLALDCVVCGGCPDEVFYAVCDALQAHGAASVWGEFADGICLIERIGRRWVAVEAPLPVASLAPALRRWRQVATGLGLGFYRSRIFDGARQALRRELDEAFA